MYAISFVTSLSSDTFLLFLFHIFCIFPTLFPLPSGDRSVLLLLWGQEVEGKGKVVGRSVARGGIGRHGTAREIPRLKVGIWATGRKEQVLGKSGKEMGRLRCSHSLPRHRKWTAIGEREREGERGRERERGREKRSADLVVLSPPRRNPFPEPDSQSLETNIYIYQHCP